MLTWQVFQNVGMTIGIMPVTTTEGGAGGARRPLWSLSRQWDGAGPLLGCPAFSGRVSGVVFAGSRFIQTGFVVA